MSNDGKLVHTFVQGKIEYLRHAKPAETRAMLAQLRRGAGKAPGELPELWVMTLRDLPEPLYGKQGEASLGEWAVHLALTLFALHQQGRDIQTECMADSDASLGSAAKELISNQDDFTRIKRRFDAALTAQSPQELATHLRQLVQMFRAQKCRLDYARLASDLFFFQMDGARDNVRLKWGRDFYRLPDLNKDTNPQQPEGDSIELKD